MSISLYFYFDHYFCAGPLDGADIDVHPHISICSDENSSSQRTTLASGPFNMPAEDWPHNATWMAYGATEHAWGRGGVYGNSRAIARRDLIRIAASISRFEPVNMLIANHQDLMQAQQFLGEIKMEQVVHAGPNGLPDIEAGGKINFITCPLDDLWMRDTGPTFVHNDQMKVYGVDFNFNGWGQTNTNASGWEKDRQKARNGIADQPIDNDRRVARFILDYTGIERLTTWLVMEGGAIEVDGHGTAICTESSILNPNRNPGKTKTDVEVELQRILGIQKVIWLPGLKAQEVTDGHVDFYARFTSEATVVYGLDEDRDSPDYGPTHLNGEILSAATDARGRKINAIPMLAPNYTKMKRAVKSRLGRTPFNDNGFAAGYIGFYATQHCIVMAKFGDDEADEKAFQLIGRLYPDRTVIQITTDGIANGGGTIHCATQQQIQ